MNANRSSALYALWLALAIAGCASREHMSEDHGRQSRAFLAEQRVYSDAEQGSPGGLDTEEAAAVRDRYKARLGPEEKSGRPDTASRVLVLEDPDVAKSKQ